MALITNFCVTQSRTTFRIRFSLRVVKKRSERKKKPALSSITLFFHFVALLFWHLRNFYRYLWNCLQCEGNIIKRKIRRLKILTRILFNLVRLNLMKRWSFIYFLGMEENRYFPPEIPPDNFQMAVFPPLRGAPPIAVQQAWSYLSAPGIPGSPFPASGWAVEFHRNSFARRSLSPPVHVVGHASKSLGGTENMGCSCAILTLTPHKPE